MKKSPESSTRQVRRSSPWIVIALAFSAVLLDGFDTGALALLVPHLSEDWSVSAAVFTYPLVLTNFGVVIGYLSCGALSARFGQRRMLVLGLLIFGLATIGTAVTLHFESISILTITRAVTGIGLGLVMPVAVVLATGSVSEKRRQTVAIAVTMGLTSGVAVVGFLGNYLIGHFGTAGVFWVAGIAPLVLVPLAIFFIPEITSQPKDDEGKQPSQVSQILGREIRTSTLALWVVTFLVFVVSYTLKSWVPTLLHDYGLDPSTAGLGLAFLSTGGIVGGLILMLLSPKLGSARALVIMSLVGAVAVAAFAKLSMSPALLLVTIFIAGAGVVAGQVGKNAIVVSLYHKSALPTGVGWADAVGRVGSIVGPLITGALLGLALPAQDIVLLFAAPLVIAAVGFAFLSRRTAEPKGTSTTDSQEREVTTDSQEREVTTAR
ncbi:MFS transporter [Corynebacterium sp. A21]|uniref:MFS transporter n=1 Tax=Corynebacterium sp. A21 TaxID=3457318 RepID=UPI003FD2B3AC